MREPLVLTGLPLEPVIVARPVTFAGCCGALFVLACYVAGWLIDGASL
jgi:hypothetical protein